MEVLGSIHRRQLFTTPRYGSCGFVMEPEDGLAQRGLAGATLTDQTDDLPLGDFQGHTINSVHSLASAEFEVLDQSVDGDKRGHERSLRKCSVSTRREAASG